MIVYRCTECDSTYSTLRAAGRCHWGIGGVVAEPVIDDEPATDEQIEAIAEMVYGQIEADPVQSALLDYFRSGGRLTKPVGGDLQENWVEAILNADDVRDFENGGGDS